MSHSGPRRSAIAPKREDRRNGPTEGGAKAKLVSNSLSPLPATRSISRKKSTADGAA
jgi:hypothetical protein